MSDFAFIASVERDHSVALSCRVLGVSRSGYYAWRTRPLSARARADSALADQIRRIHAESRGTYGSPRVHAELCFAGVRCGRNRVARLMRQAGLVGCHRRRAWKTTTSDPTVSPAPDLVGRRFTAGAPDRLWVADITYVRTGEGWR